MMEPGRGHHCMAATSTAPESGADSALERYLRIREGGSTVDAEVRASLLC